MSSRRNWGRVKRSHELLTRSEGAIDSEKCKVQKFKFGRNIGEIKEKM